MPYFITNACIDVQDRACVDVCPVDCIHPVDGADEPMLYIDPDECIDCGACEPECPLEAIYAEDDLPDDQLKYIEVNTKYFELKDDQDAWLGWKEQNDVLFQKNESSA